MEELNDLYCKLRGEYLSAKGANSQSVKAALIDMDGVLYDSMPLHAKAWHTTMTELGINCTVDEFFLYEGMTGEATINLIMKRETGEEVDAAEARKIYARKTEIFKSFGAKPLMEGASEMLEQLKRLGIRCVLVTGSGQQSLLSEIDHDYPGIFLPSDRITAHDVKHGKPHPEPYLRGLGKAGVDAEQAVVIENAPLGVRAGVAAGVFTFAITTGLVPRQAFVEERANMIFPSMPQFAEFLKSMPEL